MTLHCFFHNEVFSVYWNLANLGERTWLINLFKKSMIRKQHLEDEKVTFPIHRQFFIVYNKSKLITKVVEVILPFFPG